MTNCNNTNSLPKCPPHFDSKEWPKLMFEIGDLSADCLRLWSEKNYLDFELYKTELFDCVETMNDLNKSTSGAYFFKDFIEVKNIITRQDEIRNKRINEGNKIFAKYAERLMKVGEPVFTNPDVIKILELLEKLEDEAGITAEYVGNETKVMTKPEAIQALKGKFKNHPNQKDWQNGIFKELMTPKAIDSKMEIVEHPEIEGFYGE